LITKGADFNEISTRSRNPHASASIVLNVSCIFIQNHPQEWVPSNLFPLTAVGLAEPM